MAALAGFDPLAVLEEPSPFRQDVIAAVTDAAHEIQERYRKDLAVLIANNLRKKG